MVQRALNLGEDSQTVSIPMLPPKPPLSDEKFLESQDPVGQVVQLYELKTVIYQGGIEPSLRYETCTALLTFFESTSCFSAVDCHFFFLTQESCLEAYSQCVP